MDGLLKSDDLHTFIAHAVGSWTRWFRIATCLGDFTTRLQSHSKRHALALHSIVMSKGWNLASVIESKQGQSPHTHTVSHDFLSLHRNDRSARKHANAPDSFHLEPVGMDARC